MSWPRAGSDCFLGPPAAFLLGSRLASGAPGAPWLLLESLAFPGARAVFFSVPGLQVLLLEPGVSFHQPLGWQLELLLGPGISACHPPDLWLDPWVSPPCAAAQLYLCSPVVCIKILENKLTCRSGICLDKTFFFFKAKFNNFDLCFWFCQCSK